MESWYKRLPMKLPLSITTCQFVIAVTFITIAGFILTYLGMDYLEKPTGYVLVLGIQAVLAFNAFVPHIATTIRFRMYSPGVITSVLVVLPFSFYVFRRAFEENILTWSQFWIMLGIAPLAVIIIAFFSLLVGKALERIAFKPLTSTS